MTISSTWLASSTVAFINTESPGNGLVLSWVTEKIVGDDLEISELFSKYVLLGPTVETIPQISIKSESK